MKIFVDENIPNVTVQALAGLLHEVKDIRGTADQGMDDEKLWAMVQREGRLIITERGPVRGFHAGRLTACWARHKQRLATMVVKTCDEFSVQCWSEPRRFAWHFSRAQSDVGAEKESPAG